MERVTRWIGNLLGRDDLTHIDEAAASFGAAWAHQSPVLVLLAIAAAFGLSIWFYLRRQRAGRSTSITLSMLRSLALAK